MRLIKTCERCGKETWVLIASLFEVAMICPDCRDEERRSPHYLDACALHVGGQSGDVERTDAEDVKQG
jgi:hypothetical protein